MAGFEGIGFSIGKHWQAVQIAGDAFDIEAYVKRVWVEPEYTRSFSGLRARERMARVIPAAERVIVDMLPLTPRLRSAVATEKVATKQGPTKKQAAKRTRAG